MYEELASKGFQIFAFPCNQFMNQEPGTPEEIKKFIREKYGGTFPIFEKILVNGDDTHEIFKYLRRNSELWDEKTQTMQNIPWNFGKFLVDEEGHVQAYYGPKVNPLQMMDKVDEMLEK